MLVLFKLLTCVWNADIAVFSAILNDYYSPISLLRRALWFVYSEVKDLLSNPATSCVLVAERCAD